MWNELVAFLQPPPMPIPHFCLFPQRATKADEHSGLYINSSSFHQTLKIIKQNTKGKKQKDITISPKLNMLRTKNATETQSAETDPSKCLLVFGSWNRKKK